MTQGPDAGLRESLFRLLTEEIRDIDSGAKQQGWTPWVLSVGIATAALVLLEDTWGSPVTQTSILSYAIVSLMVFGSKGVMAAARIIDADKAKVGLFRDAGGSLGSIDDVIMGVWMYSVVAGVHASNIGTDFGVAFVAKSWIAVAGTALLISPIIRLANFPVVVPYSPPKHYVFASIANLILIVVLLVACIDLVPNTPSAIPDLRAGALGGAIAFMLLLLARGHDAQLGPRTTLVRLRRELVLGTHNSAAIAQDLSSTLEGMSLGELVRDDTQAVLGLVSEVRSIYREALQQFETLKANLSERNGEGVRDVDRLAIANTLDLMKAREAEVTDLSTQYHKKLAWLNGRLGTAGRAARAVAERNKVRELVGQAEAEANAEQMQFKSEYLSLQNEWNRLFPNEQRNHVPFRAQ